MRLQAAHRVRKCLIVIAALSTFAWQPAAASCIEYGPVTLTGTVVRQTYAGPPDYESVTKGDEPRVIWVLLLEPGICALDPKQRYPRERYEREIQLVVGSDQYTSLGSLLGKKIVATGELQHGGAKYHKRLVLVVSETARR